MAWFLALLVAAWFTLTPTVREITFEGLPGSFGPVVERVASVFDSTPTISTRW